MLKFAEWTVEAEIEGEWTFVSQFINRGDANTAMYEYRVTNPGVLVRVLPTNPAGWSQQ